MREDIERHLAHRPLRHAAEPSPRERARKWVRRHPRLYAAAKAAVVSAAVIAGAAWLEVHDRELKRSRATEAFVRLETDWNAEHALLNSVLNSYSRSDQRRAADLARGALAPYGVIDNPRWRDEPLVTALPPDRREQLGERVGGLLLAWAEAEMRWAADEPGDGRQAAVSLARRLTEQATASGGRGGAGLAEWAILQQKLGPGDHRALTERATHTPPRTADDHFFLGRALARQNEWKLAIPHFQEAVRLEPKHFWALNNLGNCYFDLGQRRDASPATAPASAWPGTIR